MPNPFMNDNGQWETKHEDGTISLHTSRAAGRAAKKLPTAPVDQDPIKAAPPWENPPEEPSEPKEKPLPQKVKSSAPKKVTSTENGELKMESYVETSGVLKTLANVIVTQERKAYGSITPPQADLIMHISNQGAMSQSDLAEILGCSGGNVTMLVDNLEKANLAKRTRSEQDRRVVVVSLTKKGDSVVEKLAEHRAAVALEVFNGFSEKDLKSFSRLLNKLAVN